MPSKRAFARIFTWRVFLISASVFTVAFALYLWSLFRQLEATFDLKEEALPTRIYSDVSRIAAPLPRAMIESRLNALGYSVSASPESISFQLHAVDYPDYLVPAGHAVLDAASKPVTLRFDSDEKNALLQSVQIGETEVPELFLEPELIATLSRGGAKDRKEIRTLVRFDEIPFDLPKAIMAVEDPHFMDHQGVDPRGLARAVFVNLKTFSLAQGGSTITLQLVKNLMARRTKNIFQKVNELFLALILELRYSKESIFERYLNEVYLGQVGSLEVHGVVEGAKHFFGKSLGQLNLAEVALMAGLIRGPGYYSPYRHYDRAVERQRWVLKRMVETGFIAQGEADEAARMAVSLAPPISISNKAPYFVDFVRAEVLRSLKDRYTEEEVLAKGLRIYSTLDMQVNAAGQHAVAEGLSALEKRLKLTATDRIEGALAAVDQSTGFIKALIGGRNYAQSTFNRILNMKRQVGSTFKPFVYLAAVEKGEDPS
nr:PBP_1b: penicillin-binding protein [uncultured bacterium]